ncbi:MAG: hypothetical protein HC832_04570 [Leptolyngbyaceae cyanobacterium RM1_405_57]|nr:hypothetical protein [Leptolyngbyaceae cyanobacterium RM1_405_57]
MLWTYRVFHDRDGYCVRVVYYERDGTLISYQKEPAIPTGETAEELLQDIEAFKQAFELPILTMEELDLKIASYPPKPKKDRSQNQTLDQVMTELDLESESSETLHSRSTTKT